MKFQSFKIKNFRGIHQTKIDLSKGPKIPVYCLVGLNESGKTSILEAINSFSPEQTGVSLPELDDYKITDFHTLIPIAQRSNFNGFIDIEANVSLDSSDEEAISNHCRKVLNIKGLNKIGKIDIVRRIAFKDSVHSPGETQSLWTINLNGILPGKRKQNKIVPSTPEWFSIIKFIRSLIPKIIYFPNFLFDFPGKIYLEDPGTESQKHAYYKLVIQDILDSIDNKTNIDTHIIQRAKSADVNARKSLNALLLEMERNVSDSVFSAWDELFHQKIKKKIRLYLDIDDSGKVFLEIKLEDTDGIYEVADRSLGFRWFFVFLLLTQYRGFRTEGKSGILFLFDEPASNLHQTAQNRLLKSFKQLASKCSIIYSTHSHHMINPEWLEGAFVVKNSALSYSGDEQTYLAKNSKIVAQRYREFVNENPGETSYFQPILDILDYKISNLEPAKYSVVFEGKTDFYLALLYNKTRKTKKEKELRFNPVPGLSSSKMDNLIQLYIGLNFPFLIILDADAAGLKEKDRYIEEFGNFMNERVFCLSDIDKNWKGKEIEDLIESSDRQQIVKSVFGEEEGLSKKKFCHAIQEILATDKPFTLNDESNKNLDALADFLNKQIGESSKSQVGK